MRKTEAVLKILLPVLFYEAVLYFVSWILRFFFSNAEYPAVCGVIMSAALAMPVLIIWHRQDRKNSGNTGNSSDEGGQRHGKISPVLSYPAVFFLGMLCAFVMGELMAFLGIDKLFPNTVQEELIRSPLFLKAAGLVFLAPAAEELVYRDLFYGRLRAWIPRLPAVLITALCFSLGHGNPIQMIYAFPMALCLSACYEKGGGLAWPVLFHMGANCLSLFRGQ